MTIREILIYATNKLSKTSDSAALDSEVLLAHVLDKSKEYLLTNPNKKIDSRLEKKYFILISRRQLGWPVAYLTNNKEFFGLKFYVDKNVLIPRPETEGLVELAAKKIIDYKLKIINDKPLSILDLGTGSGCVIIALANNLQSKIYNLKFFASDISSTALSVARKNARFHKTHISFKQSDILKAWGNQNFDVIIANLPYLPKRSDPSTKFEPTGALIAKNKGLALYEELFKQIAAFSPPFKGEIKRGSLQNKTSPRPSLKGGELPLFIFLEIGHDQGAQIKKLAKRILPAYQTNIFKDLAARPRFAVLKKRYS